MATNEDIIGLAGDTAAAAVGGYAQAALGGVQTIYGLSQLPRAKAEYERARASAPSLETPAQYYENYKNAYDSEMARMQQDAIYSNMATSVQALQGAGGRALIGGLTGVVGQSAQREQQMMADERRLRLQAGSELAAAEERAIGRKEARSQNDIQMANQSYQAALGNVAGGIASMGEGLLYGLSYTDFAKGATDNNPATDAALLEVRDKYKPVNLSPTKESNNALTPNMDISKYAAASIASQVHADKVIERDYGEAVLDKAMRLNKDAEMAKKRLEELERRRFNQGSVYQQAINRETPPDPNDSNPNDLYRPTYERDGNRTFNDGRLAPGTGAMRGWENIRQKLFEEGGMVTQGDFNHDTNKIHLVQNGEKVGEATGGEYILNPKQAAAVAKQSSYAKKLFKQFATNAKKNK
jgi:hypothetical protein